MRIIVSKSGVEVRKHSRPMSILKIYPGAGLAAADLSMQMPVKVIKTSRSRLRDPSRGAAEAQVRPSVEECNDRRKGRPRLKHARTFDDHLTIPAPQTSARVETVAMVLDVLGSNRVLKQGGALLQYLWVVR